jgi:hypothetical protein
MSKTEITNEAQIMQINKFIETSVGADVSRPSPIMAFNKLKGISVGADVSRLVDVSALRSLHDIPLNKLISIIGLRRISRYPN